MAFVEFPERELDMELVMHRPESQWPPGDELNSFSDSTPSDSKAVYDLIAVTHHLGSRAGVCNDRMEMLESH